MPLVFAYGSNLDRRQRLRRCPSARDVAIAVLPRHGLAFCGWSQTWGGAVATVVPDPEGAVPGLIFDVSRRDLWALDLYEGALYRRVRGTVLTSAGPCRPWLYRHVLARPGQPSAAYLAAIMTGRKALGIAGGDLADGIALAEKSHPTGIRDRDSRGCMPSQHKMILARKTRKMHD